MGGLFDFTGFGGFSLSLPLFVASPESDSTWNVKS